jgi:peptide chain release factor
VKCHESRSVERNRKLAREHLITKLDNFINGEMSVENQERAREKLIRDRRKEETRYRCAFLKFYFS